MYIKNEDLKTLIECENYLYKILCKNKNDSKKYDLFYKYNTIIEKLILKKINYNKINSKRIAEKRKLNKNYARSK